MASRRLAELCVIVGRTIDPFLQLQAFPKPLIEFVGMDEIQVYCTFVVPRKSHCSFLAVCFWQVNTGTLGG